MRVIAIPLNPLPPLEPRSPLLTRAQLIDTLVVALGAPFFAQPNLFLKTTSPFKIIAGLVGKCEALALPCEPFGSGFPSANTSPPTLPLLSWGKE